MIGRSVKIGSALVALATAGILYSCGAPNAPLSVLRPDESDVTELSLPVSTVGAGFAFGSETDLMPSNHFVFRLPVSFTSAVPLAPADGTVVEQSGTTVTLTHNARLSTRISNVSGLTIRLGDFVRRGTQISAQQFTQFGGTGVPGFKFEVLLDGRPICPWSFFSTNARQQLLNLASGGFNFATGVCIQ